MRPLFTPVECLEQILLPFRTDPDPPVPNHKDTPGPETLAVHGDHAAVIAELDRIGDQILDDNPKHVGISHHHRIRVHIVVDRDLLLLRLTLHLLSHLFHLFIKGHRLHLWLQPIQLRLCPVQVVLQGPDTVAQLTVDLVENLFRIDLVQNLLMDQKNQRLQLRDRTSQIVCKYGEELVLGLVESHQLPLLSVDLVVEHRQFTVLFLIADRYRSLLPVEIEETKQAERDNHQQHHGHNNGLILPLQSRGQQISLQSFTPTIKHDLVTGQWRLLIQNLKTVGHSLPLFQPDKRSEERRGVNRTD